MCSSLRCLIFNHKERGRVKSIFLCCIFFTLFKYQIIVSVLYDKAIPMNGFKSSLKMFIIIAQKSQRGDMMNVNMITID